MRNLGWADPERIGNLTLDQFFCLLGEDTRGRAGIDEAIRKGEARRREAEEWRG
jgi:hypothetical protein